jgi:hypothetical protein
VGLEPATARSGAPRSADCARRAVVYECQLENHSEHLASCSDNGRLPRNGQKTLWPGGQGVGPPSPAWARIPQASLLPASACRPSLKGTAAAAATATATATAPVAAGHELHAGNRARVEGSTGRRRVGRRAARPQPSKGARRNGGASDSGSEVREPESLCRLRRDAVPSEPSQFTNCRERPSRGVRGRAGRDRKAENAAASREGGGGGFVALALGQTLHCLLP